MASPNPSPPSGDIDLGRLCQLLETTLTTNNELRRQAETALQEMSIVPGYSTALLRLVTQDIPVEAKLSAAAQFKNTVRRLWPSINSQKSEIGDDEKHFIRENLLEAIVRETHHAVVSLLIAGAMFILDEDYPDRWDSIIQTSVNNLRNGDARRIYHTTLFLRKTFKRLEYKRDEARRMLYMISDPILPILLEVLQTCLQSDTNDAGIQAKVILKCFWSCTQFSIGNYVATEDAMTSWMGALARVMQKEVQLNGITDTDTLSHLPWWSAKKWASVTLARWVNRYGSPRHVPQEQKAAAKFFNKNLLTHVFQTVLQQLNSWANGNFVSERVRLHCLDFLRVAVEFGNCFDIIRPHLAFVIEHVLLKSFRNTQEDIELYDSDPQEFIRETYNDLNNWLSTRVAASGALLSLASKRRKHTMPIIMEMFSRFLNTYNAESDPNKKDYITKEAVLEALGSITKVLTSKAEYQPLLEPLVVQHVGPEFQSPVGWLRARAVWLFGMWSDIKYKNIENYQTLVKSVLELCQDKSPVVKFVAAYITRYFLEHEAAREIMRPVLPQLIELLFSVADELQADDVVSSLNELLRTFQDSIAGFAVPLVTKFLQFFHSFYKEAEAEEEDDNANESLSLAAMNCLDGIETVVGHLPYNAETWNQIEGMLMQLLAFILGEQAFQLEFFEDAMSLLSTCISHVPNITPALWSIFELVANAILHFAPDYIEEAFFTFDEYIAKDTDAFLNCKTSNGTPYLQLLWEIHLRMMSDMSEDEQAWSSRIFLGVCIRCDNGRLNSFLPTLVMETLKHIDSTKTGDGRVALTSVLGGCFINNTQLTLKTLEANQQTLNALELLIQSSQHDLSRLDKKVAALGLLAAMQELPIDAIEQLKHIYTGAVVLLQQRYTKTLRNEGEEEEDDEYDEGDEDEEVDYEDDEEDDDDDGPVVIGESHDIIDEEDEEYMKLLERCAAAQPGMGDFADKQQHSDSETNSRLDQINPYAVCIETITSGKFAPVCCSR